MLSKAELLAMPFEMINMTNEKLMSSGIQHHITTVPADPLKSLRCPPTVTAVET
jgi:hypothetical protein